MSYIEVENLSKTIKENVILNNINLRLEKGKIYGFFGRNGSGKTMFFRALAGLIRPTSGKVYINGKLLGKDISFPESLGIVIENTGLWDQYNSFDNLKLLASIKGEITDSEIYSIINKVGLNPDDSKKYAKFSLGMKQKLAIAQALMESPDLIILDEPTNALDYESIKNIRNLIIEHKNRGATILIASHNKEDIDELSDIQFRVDNGRIEKYSER